MLEALKALVLEANLELVRRGLVLYTFGNASGIDRVSGLVAIKPSGVPYDSMTADDMVVSDLDGKIVGGNFKPSSDLATHLELYARFRPSAALSTRILNSRLPGRRRAVRFPPTAPPTLIISTAPSRSRKNSAPKKSAATTC